MKRRLIHIILLAGLIQGTLQGQQLPHYSQYMFNDYVLNPAIAGVHDHYQIRTNHRFQWAGISDAPLTNSISFYGPHARMDMGFGGTIYTDITGPTSRTGITGSYGYNVAINRDLRISGGLSFSMLQYRIDGTQLNPKDPDDNLIQGVVSTAYVPDAAIGFYLYHDDFYAGISAMQLMNNKLKVFNQVSGLNRLRSHFYITGGYRFEVDPDWILEPSAIVKFTAPKQYRFEVNAKVEWMEMVWGGIGYRFHESLSIMVGYNHIDMIYFGYAYDIGITDLRKYNSGSHELMISYRFNDIK